MPSDRSLGKELSGRMPEDWIEGGGPERAGPLILGKSVGKAGKRVEKWRAGRAKKMRKFLLTPAPGYD